MEMKQHKEAAEKRAWESAKTDFQELHGSYFELFRMLSVSVIFILGIVIWGVLLEKGKRVAPFVPEYSECAPGKETFKATEFGTFKYLCLENGRWGNGTLIDNEKIYPGTPDNVKG